MSTATIAPPPWGRYRDNATRELATIEDVMSGDVQQVSHLERNTFDRWKLVIRGERGGVMPSLPTSQYEARKLTRFVDALDS